MNDILAHENHVPHRDDSLRAATLELEELQQERERRRQDNPLYQAEVQSAGFRQRYRTQQDILRDTVMLHARACQDYFMRLGMPNADGVAPDFLSIPRRLRGFDLSVLRHQAQTITTSLGQIAHQRYMHREDTSMKAVPLLDFEVDALMNPPRRKEGERTISV